MGHWICSGHRGWCEWVFCRQTGPVRVDEEGFHLLMDIQWCIVGRQFQHIVTMYWFQPIVTIVHFMISTQAIVTIWCFQSIVTMLWFQPIVTVVHFKISTHSNYLVFSIHSNY